jgi:FkbM family methyltransferase
MSEGRTWRPRAVIGRLFHIKLDLWEVVLIALLPLALTLKADNRTSGDREIEWFAATYGPDHYSEREEEWMIRDFFQGQRGGFFVDIGANHYKRFSKTYYLENALGWSGLAIDPLNEFAADYAEHRPNTRFFPLFVSDSSDELAKLYVISDNTLVASGNREFTELFGEPDRVETIPTVALSDLLDKEGVETIDFLSMDIELNEPKALAGLDLDRHRPRFVCIEALLPVRQVILDHFMRNGYVIAGKYLRADTENLYFVPLTD